MAASVQIVEVSTVAEIDDAIRAWVVQGYQLAIKTANSATMMKKKEFSALWAVIGFIFCVLPLLVYCIVYAAQSDRVVEIRVRSASHVDTSAELERLYKLVEQGTMTMVEFDIAKRRLMAQ